MPKLSKLVFLQPALQNGVSDNINPATHFEFSHRIGFVRLNRFNA
jgi:hypothetical protein